MSDKSDKDRDLQLVYGSVSTPHIKGDEVEMAMAMPASFRRTIICTRRSGSLLLTGDANCDAAITRAVIARLLKNVARISMDSLGAAQSTFAPISDVLPLVSKDDINLQPAPAL